MPDTEIQRKKDKVKEIKRIFDVIYKDAKCTLDYSKVYELLFSTMLAAQCTDARVNIVARELYKKYTCLEDFAVADISELESYVKSTGFFRNKAKNIKLTAQMLLEKFSGKIPSTMEELTSLPGVGRKTANIILGDVFNLPAVVTDTHCIRLARRIGLTSESQPFKVEMALQKIIPPDYQSKFCHCLVYHGRQFCMARNPNCTICPISHLCDSFTM